MSFTTAAVTTITVGPGSFSVGPVTLDLFQKTYPGYFSRKVFRTGTSSRSTTPTGIEPPIVLPRETRSLDLDPKVRLHLPIGPRYQQPSVAAAASASVNRSNTPTLSLTSARTASHNSHTPTTIRPGTPVEKFRERRNLRRQGSVFKITVPSDPAMRPKANVSSTSLASSSPSPSASSYSWTAVSIDAGGSESVYSQPTTTSSNLRQKGGLTTTHRRRDLPSPLVLSDTIRSSLDSDSQAPPRGRELSQNRPQRLPPPLSRRRSRSASLVPSPSLNSGFDSSFPTPLTPSFRFEAPHLPEHRQKKLNKLAKTLGESIPPSLVFPAHLNGSSPSTSASGPSVATDQLIKNRKRESAVAYRRTSHTIVALDLDSLSTAPSKRNPRGSSHWRPPPEWELEPEQDSKMDYRRRTVFEDRDKHDDENDDKYGDAESILGVWNAETYNDVLERLRNLKG